MEEETQQGSKWQRIFLNFGFETKLAALFLLLTFLAIWGN